MTVANIKAAPGGPKQEAGIQSQGYLSVGKVGDTVSGTVTKIENGKITIKFGKKELEAPESSLKKARVGETRQFEIMEASEQGITLKEAGHPNETGNSRGIYCTGVKMDKTAASIQEDSKALQTGEPEEKAEQAEKKLEDAGNRMSEEDMDELEQEGISIERYNMERLDKALQRIKRQKRDKSQAIELTAEKRQDYQKQIEDASKAGIINNPRQAQIAEKLLEADLPVTQDNIENIENALKQMDAAGVMTDQAMKYMISNELAPTVENIYHSIYAGSSAKYSGSPEAVQGLSGGGGPDMEAWEELLPQVEKIIADAGMPVNENTIRQAQWLFSNELPVTKENIEALEALEGIREGEGAEEALDRMIQAVSQGDRPEQAAVGKGDENAIRTVEDFLSELKRLETSLNGTDAAQITARRQIEEIRLKMTTEAGQRLLAKGIRLDTSDLERVVEGLREQENEYYRQLLQEAGAPEGEKNVALLRETTEKVNALKEAPAVLLGVTFAARRVQTVNALHETAVEWKAEAGRAEETYEALMTKPRSDMGDSIRKAFGNVDSILEDMKLDTTEANRRAVRILGYNHMEITEENIDSIKAYDAQVNTLFHEFHPAVAARMIKEGFNPLDMPVSSLNEEIVRQKQDMGIDGEQKYSEFLWKLDQEESFNSEERRAFIGIYRLLNQVEKSDGAAVGAVLDMGREVTLTNLLTAVRTRKSKGINREVDESFGALSKISRSKESISEQVEYFSHLAADIREHLEPQTFTWTAGPEGDFSSKLNRFMNMPAERLKEAMDEAKPDRELDRAYNTERLEQLREFAKTAETEIGFLTRYGQDVTMENLIGARQLLSGGRELFKSLLSREENGDERERELKEGLLSLSGQDGGPEEMQAAYDRVEEGMKAILSKEYEKPVLHYKDLAALKSLGSGIELAKALSREEYYEIPVLTGDQVTNVKLTIIKGKKENGKVHVSMDSEQLGKMEAELSIRDHTVKGYVLCENKEGLQAFKEERENLEAAMDGLGLDVGQLDYGMDKGRSTYYARSESGGEENTDTTVLYQAARAFIQGIKAAEGRQQKGLVHNEN